MEVAVVTRGRFAVGYNERLFSSGLRKWVHEARFKWLEQELKKCSVTKAAIVDLGCFDCRALRHVAQDFKSYCGFDADWEGGLSAAALRLTDPRITLHRCEAPADFEPGSCDIVISLETLEHIEPSSLPVYLRRIAQSLSYGGVILISIPNETGPLFLAKQIYKALFLEGASDYSLSETLFQTLGIVSRVGRREHKGFSWRNFVRELRAFFEVQEVAGLQARFLPAFLNPTIGITAKKRRA